MPRGYPVSDRDRKVIAAEWVHGTDTAANVAAKYGLAEVTIWEWARRYYPDVRRDRPKPKPPVKPLSALPVLSQAIELVASGVSVRQAAKRLGVTDNALYRALRKHAPDVVPPPRRRYVPVETKRAVVSDYLGGMALKATAEKHGVSEKSVMTWAYEGW